MRRRMKMKMNKAFWVAVLGLVATVTVRGQSTEDPVLDLLVKKGLVSQQEADTARQEEKDIQEQAPASRVFLANKSVQKREFYGDGRLRFDAYSQQNYNYDSKNIADRYRYRIRFGAVYTYSP